MYFNYVDFLTQERKSFSKSGFNSYDDALLYEKQKKLELSSTQRYIKKI